MKIAIAGAGPAGLYFALLMKKAWPGHAISVFEQNAKDATYGFGVVLSDAALFHLEDADDTFFPLLSRASEHWDDLTITHHGTEVKIDGNGFSGISRLKLLNILYGLCAEAGVDIHFSAPFEMQAAHGAFDLIVGADGVNSTVRTYLEADFKPQISTLTNRFAWFGTNTPFDTLGLTFKTFEGGAYVAHHYHYAPQMSTFIVECDATTFARSGLSEMSTMQARTHCERIFAEELGGAELISNNSIWRQFPVITNDNWTVENTVLLGDALRTIHFSIGSGTRLAMEDAIALFRAFRDVGPNVEAALEAFVHARKPQVDKLLTAARGSYTWYENFAEKLPLSPYDLAYDYMTRSGRISDERLNKIAPEFHARWQTAQSRKAK